MEKTGVDTVGVDWQEPGFAYRVLRSMMRSDVAVPVEFVPCEMKQMQKMQRLFSLGGHLTIN